MFQDELEIFADACRSGSATKLTAHDGNVAVAMVYAGLKSVENNALMVSVDEVMSEHRRDLILYCLVV